MIDLLRRRMEMGLDKVKIYDFIPLLYSTQIDGYNEDGVEQFNTDAYDLSTAEVNIIEKFNASKLKKKACIFSILSTSTSINVSHTNATIRLFQTIDGEEMFSDHTENGENISLTSGSVNRYAIVYNTTKGISIRDNDLIAAAGVVNYSLFRGAGGAYKTKQLYYSNGAIPPLLAYWQSASGKVYRIPEYLKELYGYATQATLASQIVIPSNFTSLESGNFQNAPLNVGTLVIPESVTSIGNGCFSYQIKKLYLKSPARFVWQFVNGTTIVDKQITITDSADAEKNGLNRGYKLENDGTYFYYINKETNEKLLLKANANSTIIELQDGVTLNIGAFAGCENAVPQGDIVLPNSNDSLFCKCKKLTSITIPNSVTSIGNYALAETGLTSITIPNSVTSIGNYALSKCSSLSNIEIQGTSLKTIGNYAFNSVGITSINIPDSVTSIGEGAFQNNNLEEITIPSGVTRIPINLCISSKKLKRATCLGNITDISGWNTTGAFENCTSLEYFSIKGTFPLLKALLNSCTSLKTLILDVENPPGTADWDYFGNSSNRKATTVYVPEASVDAYNADSFWGLYTIKPLSELPA